jgi:hypothetical protein
MKPSRMQGGRRASVLEIDRSSHETTAEKERRKKTAYARGIRGRHKNSKVINFAG